MPATQLEFADLLTDRLRELLPDALIEARVPPVDFARQAVAIKVSRVVGGKEIVAERMVSTRCDGYDSPKAAVNRHACLIAGDFIWIQSEQT